MKFIKLWIPLIIILVIIMVAGGRILLGKKTYPQPSAVVVNWKPYSNLTWGIAFDYPATWDIKASGTNYIVLYSPSLMMGITYIDNPKDLSLSQIDQESAKADQERGTGVESEKLSPSNYSTATIGDGYTAYYEKEYFCEPSMCERYIVQRPHKIITITIFPRDNHDIDRILSTLRFIDKNTYVNTKYGFSLIHPEDMIVEEIEPEYGWIGKRIWFGVSDNNPGDCRGPCPNSTSNNKVTVAGIEANESVGTIGEIGGNISQGYVSVNFFKNNKYTTFVLYALDKDATEPIGNQTRKILEKDRTAFMQILSTLKFSH